MRFALVSGRLIGLMGTNTKPNGCATSSTGRAPLLRPLFREKQNKNSTTFGGAFLAFSRKKPTRKRSVTLQSNAHNYCTFAWLGGNIRRSVRSSEPPLPWFEGGSLIGYYLSYLAWRRPLEFQWGGWQGKLQKQHQLTSHRFS